MSREAQEYKTQQLTLSQLIARIENIGLVNKKRTNPEPKTVCFDFGSALPTTLDSWRGDYSELALGYELSGYDGKGDYSGRTAEKLLNELKSALGKTFEGWKGGDFTMKEYTPIWVSNRGNADHTVIVDVLDCDYQIVLLTAFCEY